MGFYPFVDLLTAPQCDVALLSEPHLHPQARLPFDQLFTIFSNPHPPGCADNRRDAAIMCGQAAQQAGMQRVPLSSDRDIVACLCRHGAAVSDTVFISAYAPDSSRGPAARLSVWQRLSYALQKVTSLHPSADIVLGLDSNTWLAELDFSRQVSTDAAVFRQILCTFDLHLWSPPGEATHISGTIIDVVAASSRIQVSNFQVHGPACASSCRHFPSCCPVLGSDHISFLLI